MKVGISADYRVWALLSVFLQVLSIIVLKYTAISCGSFFCWPLVYFYASVAFFILLRVLFWNLALSRGTLSNVYMFTALTPMLMLWLSVAILDEKISLTSALGTGIVVLAIYMQQRGRQKAA